MLINRRNAMMAGKQLPYTAVEYIQANGIAYIDTGVPFTTDYIAKCKFQLVSSSSENLSPFGFYYNAGGVTRGARMYWRGGSSDWRYQYPTTSATVFASGSSMPFGNIHELEIGPFGVTMDGTAASVTAASFTTSTYSQHLFGSVSYNPGDGGFKHEQQSASSVIRIYSASWTDGNGVLVRDFIPVRFTNEFGQSEGAMFDRANPTVGMNPDGSARADGLYRNRGTGAFTYGNDI